MSNSDPETVLTEYRSSIPVAAAGPFDIEGGGYAIKAAGVTAAEVSDLEHELAMRDWTEADGELYHPTFVPEYGILAPPEVYDHLYATGLLLHPADRDAKLKSGKTLILSGVAVAGVFTFQALMNMTWTLIVLGVPIGLFVILLGVAKFFALRPRRLPHGGKPTPAFLSTTLSPAGDLTVKVRLVSREPEPAHGQLLQGEVDQFVSG